jgi:cytochrome c oxidase cbb3-type subunit IV
MYKQVLNSITDIEIYPVISLILFISFFALMLYKVFNSGKSWVDHMASLPLEDDVNTGAFSTDAKEPANKRI